ncbi:MULTISPECIES: hypothetical protein [unclassified Arthrobacter]|uniref:hypothetical protein n=1 Tax=unclassified Arthrobacter TaxID=235627 RepID=UPI00339542F2
MDRSPAPWLAAEHLKFPDTRRTVGGIRLICSEPESDRIKDIVTWQLDPPQTGIGADHFSHRTNPGTVKRNHVHQLEALG